MANVVKKLTEQERIHKQLLDTLAELGGKAVGEKDVEFGEKFMAPSAFENDVDGVIQFWIQYKEAMEETTTFSRSFPYKPWDGAVAVMNAFEKNFGTKGIQVASFFERPEFVSVPIGVHESLQVPWGKIKIPIFRGIIRLGSDKDEDGNLQFRVIISTAKKNEGAVEGLFRLIRAELDTNSIYRGRAIDGSDMPQFLDLSQVTYDKLVFNDVTALQLKANIWAPITMAEIVRQEGVDTKRTILLEGPWGTGKSEIGLMTAKMCDEVGRTFLLCNPKENNVYEVLNTAAQYQPATVFIEDIDVLTSDGEPRAVQQFLDKFDGLTAKGKDIMVVMTTNHKENIHKGMLRPGRLDAITHIGVLDRDPTEKLIKQLFDPKSLGKIDYDKVFADIAGDDPNGERTGKTTTFTPAFIVETCKKVKLFAIARSDGKPDAKYETLDFLAAVKDMRDHHDLHRDAGEGQRMPSIDQSIREAVADVLDHGIKINSSYLEETLVAERMTDEERARHKKDGYVETE